MQLSTFVLPAPLLSGRRIDFFQSCPEAHGAVHCPAVVCVLSMGGVDGQFWRIHAPAFEVEKNLTPR